MILMENRGICLCTTCRLAKASGGVKVDWARCYDKLWIRQM
jgi:hypothetical protein